MSDTKSDVPAPVLGVPGLVVVTGAAGGIGQAVALHFARAGVPVALIDVDAEGLARGQRRVRDLGGQATVWHADVSKAEELAVVAEKIAADVGACAVLVNAAGILRRSALDAAETPANWSQTLAVNLTGAFHASRAFLPALKTTRGCIVNVASIHSYVAVGISAAYSASKGGLKQLTQALALELAPMGIRVNAVAPGSIDTPMTEPGRGGPGSRAFLARVPMGRTGTADEVAGVVHFLASDLASYITGVTLPVDGGYLAG